MEHFDPADPRTSKHTWQLLFTTVGALLLFTIVCFAVAEHVSTIDGWRRWNHLVRGTAMDRLTLSMSTACILLIASSFWLQTRQRLPVILVAIICLGHANQLQENHRQTFDFHCYYAAAQGAENDIDIYDSQALNHFSKEKLGLKKVEFLYSPLLPTLMAKLLPADRAENFLVWTTIVWLSLAATWLLFYFACLHLGLGLPLALLVLLLLGFNNVAADRTLLYTQVNALTLASLLVCLIAYPRQKWLSAMGLVLAINLKVSPILLVCAFILNRNVRYLIYLALGQALTMALTAWVTGAMLWKGFIDASLSISPSMHRRSAGIDALLHNAFSLWNAQNHAAGATTALKFVLGALVIVVLLKVAKTRRASEQHPYALEMLAPLLMTSLLISPFNWPHHYLLSLWPMAMLFARLESGKQYTLWGVIALSFYWLPVSDIFPFAGHRLLSLILWFVLYWQTRHNPQESKHTIYRWLASVDPWQRAPFTNITTIRHNISRS